MRQTQRNLIGFFLKLNSTIPLSPWLFTAHSNKSQRKIALGKVFQPDFSILKDFFLTEKEESYIFTGSALKGLIFNSHHMV